jgi:NAD(P)-dependent dehydrogenase (short-subunit alcohol dehydrogenase family)
MSVNGTNPSDPKVILITGASSGFGNLAARALARSGHTVYAGMRATRGRNAPAVEALAGLAAAGAVNICGIEMDVQDQASINAAVEEIMGRQGRIDVVVHNAGRMALGPTEAFTPKQLAELYDANVISTQRVNRTVLPILRGQGSGLVVWVASSSTRGGRPPFIAGYFAAKAGLDALAESYAAELVNFGVDTVIVVPGAFTDGTNLFAHAEPPADGERAGAYEDQYGEIQRNIGGALGALFPPGRDASEVADAIKRVIELPQGQRPFRVHADPIKDGSEVVSVVYDRNRVEFFRRVGIDGLLTPNASA